MTPTPGAQKDVRKNQARRSKSRVPGRLRQLVANALSSAESLGSNCWRKRQSIGGSGMHLLSEAQPSVLRRAGREGFLQRRRSPAMLCPMLMVPTSPSKPTSLPAYVRARGGVRLVLGPTPRGSAPLTIAESGGFRVRFPKGRGCEGVLINTGGGVAGGDRMFVDAALRAGADAVLTTQAAEKIYRSDGPDAEVTLALDLGAGSRLEWLPQEQILFRGARLRRTFEVALAADAKFSSLESVVFGRIAMGERMTEGAFRDRWRIRRDGRLVFAEDIRLEGAIAETLRRKATGAGAHAFATFLHIAPDAQTRCEHAREALRDASCECGVSAWDGMLIARFVAPSGQALRSDVVPFVERFRRKPMPRSWQV